MATLTIHNVDPAIEERLRIRAARNGRSPEAELRVIVMTALSGERGHDVDLAEALRRRFLPFGGVELEQHPPVAIGKPTALDP